jgi:SAM-dependent methyltransferase
VPRRTTKAMRRYWDDAAARNAIYYVDTTQRYDAPDPESFFADGRRIAGIALRQPAAQPPGRGLAVEIGCGLGRICVALADMFDRVVGVDISEEMVRQARQANDTSNVDFRVGDGVTLPDVETATADFVLTFTVFQHAPNRRVIRSNIAEAARVLRPGGVFALQWNSTPGPVRWRLHRLKMRALDRFGRADAHGRDAPQFLGSRVPLAAMDRMLAAAGFDRVALAEPESIFTWAWAVRR